MIAAGDQHMHNLAGKLVSTCLFIPKEDEIILCQIVLSQVRARLRDLLSNQIVTSNLK